MSAPVEVERSVLHQIDSVLLRLIDIQAELSCLKASLVSARLHGTQSGALKASELHPDLLSLYENVEDAEFLPGSSDYTINKKGQLVYCDHE